MSTYLFGEHYATVHVNQDLIVCSTD